MVVERKPIRLDSHTTFAPIKWMVLGALQVAGESIQLKGRIRMSLALDAFPCQQQLAFEQDSSSSPNNFIASASESDTLPHFFCRLML